MVHVCRDASTVVRGIAPRAARLQSPLAAHAPPAAALPGAMPRTPVTSMAAEPRPGASDHQIPDRGYERSVLTLPLGGQQGQRLRQPESGWRGRRRPSSLPAWGRALRRRP